MIRYRKNKDSEKNNETKIDYEKILNGLSNRCDMLQKLIDTIPDYIYIKDKKNRFVMVNSAMANFHRKKPEDFIGKTDFDFAPKEMAKEYSRDDNWIIKNKEPIIDKSEKLIRSGKELWVSCSKIPWYDRNGKIMGTMGISRDITRRKQSEDDLLSNEKNLFDSLMNNIPESIFYKDLNSRFVRINRACAKKHEIKNPEDAIGKTDFDFFSEEHAKQAYEDEQKIIRTGKPIVDLEEKETFKDKEDKWASTTKMPWYDRNKNIIGIFGITRDITSRKVIENKLEREVSFMKALMERTPDSIYFKDRDSRFVLVNKALAENFSIKNPEDAIGKTDFDFFSEEHAKQAYKDEQKVIKTGRPIIGFEEKETFKDKPDRWVFTSKLPWYDKNNNIIGIFGITRDITEKKKSEERIKYLSFHDTLTGLYNRAYFDEELKRLDTVRQLPITIVMGDINGLKMINDAYGHEKGDRFLRKIADILKDTFRKEDIVSRWGGDEFIAILPRTREKDTKSIIKRIKELCCERTTADIPLSIAIGISSKKSPQEDMNIVLKEAEDRMYKNKLSESRSTNELVISSLKENLKKTEHNGGKHGDKMQRYALAIGKRLNLSDAKLDELKLVMDLHNIGKLALADEIISKPGRLTEEEWKIIKKLPEIGYRIAESSMVLKPISEAILSHNEWYNGEGYPRGVRGEDIPILSRISFVVNSYEAMITDRPYRKKMTVKDVIKEIKRCGGTQFDPKIVKIFLEILEKNTPR
ncbi:MAG: PAS domain-containing protein [Actinomycetota bacterium]|nr:PAS domain-containing protein [Actinomycetota bacterium]